MTSLRFRWEKRMGGVQVTSSRIGSPCVVLTIRIFLELQLLSTSGSRIAFFRVETTRIFCWFKLEIILCKSIKCYLIVRLLPVENPWLVVVLLILLRVLVRILLAIFCVVKFREFLELSVRLFVVESVLVVSL
uniref:Uncharacterized protein n=1 Tax=Cacopsylla melanoneura TaxID=428564 RepID=A0A8D9FE49_9HEMI